MITVYAADLALINWRRITFADLEPTNLFCLIALLIAFGWPVLLVIWSIAGWRRIRSFIATRKQPVHDLRRGWTTLLVVLTIYLAILSSPHNPWSLTLPLVTIAAIAASTLFLRVGWIVPCMITGAYLGIVLDSSVKGGDAESQMIETVRSICIWAAIGILAGLAFDRPWRRVKSHDLVTKETKPE